MFPLDHLLLVPPEVLIDWSFPMNSAENSSGQTVSFIFFKFHTKPLFGNQILFPPAFHIPKIEIYRHCTLCIYTLYPHHYFCLFLGLNSQKDPKMHFWIKIEKQNFQHNDINMSLASFDQIFWCRYLPIIFNTFFSGYSMRCKLAQCFA